MTCPFCRHGDTKVLDSRATDDGTAIRRRRACLACDRRFSTVEQVSLAVLKRSGITEPFSRDKVLAGVRKACQGRPVTEDQLARLAASVEERVRAMALAEVPSNEVGMTILGPLRELDEVAYLRFASVYRSFESLADFEAEIALLRAERDTGDVSDTGDTGDTSDTTVSRPGDDGASVSSSRPGWPGEPATGAAASPGPPGRAVARSGRP